LPDTDPRRAIIVFGKNPVSGQAKTRLAGAIGFDAAARVYRSFLLDTLDALKAIDAQVRLYLAPSEKPIDPAILSRSPSFNWQSGIDLGERMSKAFIETFEAGFSEACVIGSDHPSLPLRILEKAFSELDSGHAVFGPSTDGGYYLVALDRPRAELFANVQFGRPDVLENTIEKAEALGMEPSLLEPWYDVDTAEDLGRLVDDLRGNPVICPETRKTLRSLGLL
jgi:rSAM/selenodomain-associated transferase 1